MDRSRLLVALAASVVLAVPVGLWNGSADPSYWTLRAVGAVVIGGALLYAFWPDVHRHRRRR